MSITTEPCDCFRYVKLKNRKSSEPNISMPSSAAVAKMYVIESESMSRLKNSMTNAPETKIAPDDT